MKLRYSGLAFRAHHAVGLRALARGSGVRPGRLIDLEKGRTVADLTDLARIIAFFRGQGIECRLADLVEEAEEEQTDGNQDGD